MKRITELSRVDYIWLKFDTHVIEVWSYQERYLAKAVRMLNRRIVGLMPPEKVVEKGPENTVIETWNECDVSFTHTQGTFAHLKHRRYPRNIAYTITGKESDCLKAFEKILKEYPYNPYFTKMRSKVNNGDSGITVIKVTRSDSSD